MTNIQKTPSNTQEEDLDRYTEGHRRAVEADFYEENRGPLSVGRQVMRALTTRRFSRGLTNGIFDDPRAKHAQGDRVSEYSDAVRVIADLSRYVRQDKPEFPGRYSYDYNPAFTGYYSKEEVDSIKLSVVDELSSFAPATQFSERESRYEMTTEGQENDTQYRLKDLGEVHRTLHRHLGIYKDIVKMLFQLPGGEKAYYTLAESKSLHGAETQLMLPQLGEVVGVYGALASLLDDEDKPSLTVASLVTVDVEDRSGYGTYKNPRVFLAVPSEA